ncbi:MAG: hypothetical protein DME22_14145 [Verrucomicrobia bacterium]|nr:MAG: hypothetical protein DME22_14145 [Verrucomicrobiota bacterium]
MRPNSTTAANRAGFCLLGGLALATLLGCQSASGPRFDARAASAAKLGALTNFTTVAETNLLSLEWLKPPTNRFTLGPGDNLEIEIMGDTLTRATNFVAPDGRLYYYLLPGLDVWGLTLADTRALIERELLKYMREQPQVSDFDRGAFAGGRAQQLILSSGVARRRTDGLRVFGGNCGFAPQLRHARRSDAAGGFPSAGEGRRHVAKHLSAPG